MTTLSYTHIARDERIQIESHLHHGNTSLKILASQLSRSPKAIRNEIKKHRYIVVRENRRNKCGRQLYCMRQHLCDDCETVFAKHAAIRGKEKISYTFHPSNAAGNTFLFILRIILTIYD